MDTWYSRLETVILPGQSVRSPTFAPSCLAIVMFEKDTASCATFLQNVWQGETGTLPRLRRNTFRYFESRDRTKSPNETMGEGTDQIPDFKLRIDAHALVQLGEQLITDDEQALLEIVKNSYDADAEWARIRIN